MFILFERAFTRYIWSEWRAIFTSEFKHCVILSTILALLNNVDQNTQVGLPDHMVMQAFLPRIPQSGVDLPWGWACEQNVEEAPEL